MIKEVNGDILFSTAQAVAHGVAPNDHFNSGLALSLREEFPAMYKDFRQYCFKAHPKPGEVWFWRGAGQKVINLLTQEPPQNGNGHPGKASIVFVNHALRELVKLIEKERLESIAIPRLATGVGGLDWDEVRPVIYHFLEPLETRVYLYSQFSKGVKAVE